MDDIAPRLHVCFVNVARGIGGVERVVEHHAANLNPKRFRLSYAYTPFTGDESHIAHLQAAGVNIIRLQHILPYSPSRPATPAGPARRSATRFWKKLVPVRLDEIVFHMRNTRGLTRSFEAGLSNISPPPNIFQLVAGDYFWVSSAYGVCRRLYPMARMKLHLGNPPVFLNPTFLERKVFANADSLSFVSNDTKKAWEKALGFTLPLGRVLRTPVTTETIPYIERSKSSPAEPFVLATVGRISPIKGVDIAIQAVRRLKDSGANVLLWVMGIGPQESRMQQLAKDLGVSENVVFMGFVNDPAALFPRIDFLLQPSTRTEGIPNSVLEAMASGMPVIASRVGGLPEAIKHRETGVLVDPSDPAQIADAVMELISDISFRTKIGRTASEHVRTYYAAPAATASLARVYEALASGRPATATQAS